MEITEVRIKLMEEAGERLQAFCSITFDDCFVIRDLKIIEGTNGPFVAMPSRKLTAHCPQCGCKNHLRAAYCNQCGGRLTEDRLVKDEDGRAKLYADIAHPINSACREMIQERVIREFQAELARSKLPGYKSTYDDYDPEDAVATTSQPHGNDSVIKRDKTHVQPAGVAPPQSAHAAEQCRSSRRAATARVPQEIKARRFRSGHFLAWRRTRPRRRCETVASRAYQLLPPLTLCTVPSIVANMRPSRPFRPGKCVLPKNNASRLHIVGREVWLLILPFAPRVRSRVPARRENHAQNARFYRF